MNNAAIAIAYTEARPEVDKAESTAEKLYAAMRVCKGHWMVTDPNEQLVAAVATVMTALQEAGNLADYGRLQTETRMVRALGAASAGLPIDFTQLVLDDNFEPFGLGAMWREILEEE